METKLPHLIGLRCELGRFTGIVQNRSPSRPQPLLHRPRALIKSRNAHTTGILILLNCSGQDRSWN